ncbi:MAG: hypothetical protein ACK5OR_00450, partial [Betaproteobacteria bacterium]
MARAIAALGSKCEAEPSSTTSSDVRQRSAPSSRSRKAALARGDRLNRKHTVKPSDRSKCRRSRS